MALVTISLARPADDKTDVQKNSKDEAKLSSEVNDEIKTEKSDLDNDNGMTTTELFGVFDSIIIPEEEAPQVRILGAINKAL